MKRFNITVNGKSYYVEAQELDANAPAPVMAAPAPAAAAPAPAAAPAAPAPAPAAAPAAAPASGGVTGSVKITSPMPGAILDVKVSVGEQVTKGQALCILEAMKMENEIVAPDNGTVAGVHVDKGASVEVGALLISLN
ncbi:biotin/lipoyl-containing protein [Oscillospiraceae bacterium MB08-C2-2]|nr:biotin/lipoyl-containing protein [Oscillospiraceae bacterium MB08-C2-2]